MDKKYGDLNVTCMYDMVGGVFGYKYEWIGGRYLAISKILAEAHPEFQGQWIPGTNIKIGPFTMEVIGLIANIAGYQDTVVCKRLTPVWWARFMVWLHR